MYSVGDKVVHPMHGAGTIEAIVCDSEIYRVFDQKYSVGVAYNAKGLYWNYFLHHSFNLRQLIHQIDFIMKSSCCIAN